MTERAFFDSLISMVGLPDKVYLQRKLALNAYLQELEEKKKLHTRLEEVENTLHDIEKRLKDILYNTRRDPDAQFDTQMVDLALARLKLFMSEITFLRKATSTLQDLDL